MRAAVALLLVASCATAPQPVIEPSPTHPDLSTELSAMRDADQEARKRWLKDQERVDERRIRAGMGPLADYKAQLCALYLQNQP